MHKITIPPGEYVKNINTSDSEIIVELAKRKKVALLFISLNDRYWPYVGQVIKDCRQKFLPHHQVDYFVWTDYSESGKQKVLKQLEDLYTAYVQAPENKKPEAVGNLLAVFAQIVRLYEVFYPQQIIQAVNELQQIGMVFKRNGANYWVESARPLNDNDVQLFYTVARNVLQLAFSDLAESLKGVTTIETEPMEWPIPTLMRYHLFLNEEEKLKEYDYIFYLDADMRVVATIGDEIMGDNLTAAQHPMYDLRKEYIPPYEPNPASTAYIPRPGKIIVDENGKPRFQPYYYAGGFQGGPAPLFLEAMRVMKRNIDKDFDNNYTAVWNDESHWNKYLFDNPPAIVLSPAYIYPDSLIDDYYVKVWGKKYEPKIITLTKPFSLSAQGASEIQKFVQGS